MDKWGRENITIYNANCLDILPTIPDASVDAIISDPPYAEIDRKYGRLTEKQWHKLMREVVEQSKRVLKPNGSAVFILQPNSKHVGEMRLWVWEFMVWAGKHWNIIQDCYWWNHTTPPNVHCHRDIGLMRPSVKYLVWLGSPNCYRNQDKILWEPSASTQASNLSKRADNKLVYKPCGMSMRHQRCLETNKERGGTTPFNLLPMPGGNSVTDSGAFGHGAGTPEQLVNWLVRYITKPNDVILDMFNGAGTTGIVAYKMGRQYIGIEQDKGYYETSIKRIESEMDKPVFNEIAS